MKKRARTIVSLAAVGVLGIFTAERAPNDYCSSGTEIGKDTVVCLMAIEGDMYSTRVDRIGYNYALFRKMSEDLGCHVEFRHSIMPSSVDPPTDSLLNGNYDLAVADIRDSILTVNDSRLAPLSPLSDDFLWISAANNRQLIYAVNRWIAAIKGNGEAEAISKRFYGRSDIGKAVSSGKMLDRISPYDEIIKKYSRRLDWDWRLLAAVIYQESKFFTGTTSKRGAAGLMQIKPSTGDAHGVDDIFLPENNIDAGTRHLAYLQNIFIKDNISGNDCIRFTLAAYNAGEGRIEDCRNLARALGKDPNRWDDVASVIPFMRQEEYYKSEYVKRGRFLGDETLRYVRNVLFRYEEYCAAVNE